MITLNAIEQNTYQQLRLAICNLPQGSTFQVRDIFRVCKISGWKLVNSWLGNYGNAHRIPTTNLTNSIC